MGFAVINPLLDTAPMIAKLRSNPLERVLAAVAFPPILRISDATGAGIAEFQERVRSRYPFLVMEQEAGVEVQINPDGTFSSSNKLTPVWRFFDHAREWRVSLTPQALALETQRQYENRNDLLEKLLFLVDALAQTLKPSEITRIGFRFLNVFGPTKMAELGAFVRPEFTSFGVPPYLEHLQHSSSTTQFAVPEGSLVIKHGIVAPGMMHEFMLVPVSEKRWYLDLDAWADLSDPFNEDSIVLHSRALTSRICSVFRWAITKEFLDVYASDS